MVREPHIESPPLGRPCYGGLVARILLTLWVSLFAAQVTDLFTLVVPDDCVNAASSNTDDSCPSGTCARCICCARSVAPVTQVLTVTAAVTPVVVDVPSQNSLVPSPEPRGIFHVPKTLS
jgi:hypothetical protein